MALPIETMRFDALRKLAAERFGKIEPPEEEVLRLSALAEGRNAPETEDRPEVRAAFLRWLATDKDAAAHIDPFGLRVHNTTITSVLNLDFCKLTFPLRFRHCTLQGQLYLLSAELPALYLTNCKTEHDIFADGLRLEGDIDLSELEIEGGIKLVGAQIGGDLNCSGATLISKDFALKADRAIITGSVFVRQKVSTDSGSVFVTRKFSSQGKVRFLGAQIGGDLVCYGAQVESLSCEHARLTGNLFWIGIQGSKSHSLNLLGAHVKTVQDDTASWPAPGSLSLKGLEYADLVHYEPSTEEQLSGNCMAPQLPLDAGERIRWLSLQDDEDRLDPQAWMWLAKLFKEKGDDGSARWVLLNYRLRLAVAGNWLKLPIRVLFALLSWEPLLILVFFALILFWGHQIYQRAWDQHQISPTVADAFTQRPTGSPPARPSPYAHAYPVFNPWIYTLENELPLVKFGMDDKWAPDPNLITQGNAKAYSSLTRFRLFLIFAGWIQGVLLTLGISRRFRD